MSNHSEQVYVPSNAFNKAIGYNSDLQEYLFSIDSYQKEHQDFYFDIKTFPVKFSKLLLTVSREAFLDKWGKIQGLSLYINGTAKEMMNPENRKKMEEFARKVDYSTYSFLNAYDNLSSFISDMETLEKMGKNKATSLPKLAMKLNHIFSDKLKSDCWIYKVIQPLNKPLPLLVRTIEYIPKGGGRYGRDYASVDIDLVYFNKGSSQSMRLEITTDIFRKYDRDALAILKSFDLEFGTQKHLSEYKKILKDFSKKALQQNIQFISPDGTKFINDNVFKLTPKYASPSYVYTPLEVRDGGSAFSTGGRVILPQWFDIYCFNLSHHRFDWLPSSFLEQYEYNPLIEKKLILPEEHKGLIDILLSDDVEAVGGDIIEGKGDGTIILAKGRAGIGKTVTAEVYSEKKELPLYSVHSGQLGINGEEIEEKLKKIFERAERWGCCLLVDEADTFLRERGEDVQHNAIVASFLRNLEYYNGLMFLTTNISNIDEAIESRCIAVLQYSMPTIPMRERLWKLFISQFELSVSDDVISELVEKMEDFSGRDIKNVSMLVSRYARGKKIEIIDFNVFKLCATFRGKYAIGLK